MKPKTPLTSTSEDARKVRDLVESRRSDWLVMDRTQANVEGAARSFSKEQFWYVLVGCLLTTQQRATRGTPVNRFLHLKPFPLSLRACAGGTEKHAASAIASFGGIRRGPTIARQAKFNYDWLHAEGWAPVEAHFRELAAQRSRGPRRDDAKAERAAAHFVDKAFKGIGPKQSRNLWQWLGLARYEIPLDSRVCKWINANLSIQVQMADLSDQRRYDAILDCLQDLCERAKVLPCLFDAAAFDYEGTGAAKKPAASRAAKTAT